MSKSAKEKEQIESAIKLIKLKIAAIKNIVVNIESELRAIKNITINEELNEINKIINNE